MVLINNWQVFQLVCSAKTSWRSHFEALSGTSFSVWKHMKQRTAFTRPYNNPAYFIVLFSHRSCFVSFFKLQNIFTNVVNVCWLDADIIHRVMGGVGCYSRLFILPLCPFLKTLQNPVPQDIQCVNNYSSKEVSTVFKHYFQPLNQRGILNGKTVGEESRIW